MGQRGHGWRSRLAVIGAVLAVVTTVFVADAPESGSQEGGGVQTGSGAPTVATLSLRLGAADQFTYARAAGVTDSRVPATLAPQAITENRCVASFGAPQLATLSAGSQQVGLYRDALGVFSGGGGSQARGVPCARASVGEQPLTIAIGSALSGLGITSADLDIEVKADAAIRADLYLDRDGTMTPRGSVELRSGASVQPGQGSATPGAAIFNCGARSDSGPDSGAADNCRWSIAGTGMFNRIVLTSLRGEFSLEGGADGAPATPSTFALALLPTGTVGCGDALVPQTGADGSSVEGVRGDDAGTAPGDCAPIDYGLTLDANTVRLLKLSEASPHATFIFTTTFEPEEVEAPGDYSGTFRYEPTLQRFDVDPSDPQQEFPILGCTGTPVYDGSGTFTGIQEIMSASTAALDAGLPGYDLLEDVPGTQYACAFSETIEYVGTDEIQVTQGIFLIGDWMKFR